MKSQPQVVPDLAGFLEAAKHGNTIAVWSQVAADFETPLSAYVKLRSEGHESFLLESAEKSERAGRWSILGVAPRRIYIAHADGKHCEIREPGKAPRKVAFTRDILAFLEAEMSCYRVVPTGAPPVFTGGLVGYLGFDAVRQFEPSLGPPPPDDLGLPDAVFLLADVVVVFDHRLRRMHVIANALVVQEPEAAWREAVAKISQVLAALSAPLPTPVLVAMGEVPELEATSNTSREEFEAMVERGRRLIAAGDIFQCVPSQRFAASYTGGPVNLYRALRYINPSPYMFILELDQFALVGSSPEVHVRAMNGRIDIRPIAGTRRRGADSSEDEALAEELFNDPKERAEHVMLVDLARNDVGRIAAHGSVKVDDFMIIERYSHVMHIVSNVSGTLAPGHSAYDVLRATFPAGTVSGAPKIRALQIIGELEKNKRGAYAGAVGYFGFDGAHDSCIALRTCVLKDGTAYVQAGAGVVADSQPELEYEETVSKAKAMLRAIALASTLD